MSIFSKKQKHSQGSGCNGSNLSLQPDGLPRHIAIIMDGNGRWAAKRALPRAAGHAAGAETFRRIATYCKNIGIEFLTVYAFSTENWKRPADEVKSIMELLEKYLHEALEKMERDKVRMRFSGDTSVLSPELRKLIANTEELSKKFEGVLVNICVNYGGRSEILRAAENYARDTIGAGPPTHDPVITAPCARNSYAPDLTTSSSCTSELCGGAPGYACSPNDNPSFPSGDANIDPSDGSINGDTCGELTEDRFSRYMYTAGMPDPDLIIRPSGEMRLSNFLLWQSAYSELYFTDVLWPDFNERELDRAILEYQSRQRRYGGT